MGAGSSAAKFISFEGIDGCGKSTLMEKLGDWLDELRIPYIRTREPGGTALGESIRKLLLDPSIKAMNQQTEVLLYTASRAQLVEEVIHPALKSGTWVLSDRYIDATLAYQGYGRGLDLEQLHHIQNWATGGIRPDFTVLLDCDVDIAFKRMMGRDAAADRIEMESVSFHRRVRDGYLDLARIDPKRFIVLDASKPLEEVVQEFRAAFESQSLFSM
jgi:dTMP kinase